MMCRRCLCRSHHLGLNARGNINQKKKYAKNCCQEMSPDDDNCPFILSNVTFVIFSDFVTQRKARKGKGRGKSMCLGNSSYEQFQSALKHLFRMSKYTMDPNFFVSLKQFTKGIRHHVADKKVIEGDVSIIGKKKMGFDVWTRAPAPEGFGRGWHREWGRGRVRCN